MLKLPLQEGGILGPVEPTCLECRRPYTLVQQKDAHASAIISLLVLCLGSFLPTFWKQSVAQAGLHFEICLLLFLSAGVTG